MIQYSNSKLQCIIHLDNNDNIKINGKYMNVEIKNKTSNNFKYNKKKFALIKLLSFNLF